MFGLIRHTFPATIVVCSLLSPLSAQVRPDDPLRAEEARYKIVIQKAEADVTAAIADAKKWETVSPIKATSRLMQTRIQLENDAIIPEKAKKELLARLSERIKAIESGTAPTPTLTKNETREAELARAKAIAEERTELKRGIDAISSLVKTGNDAQARKQAEALVKRYPENPAALAFTEKLSWADRVAAAKVLLGQQQEGYLLAMRSVDKSAVPPKDDIEFDAARFKEITKLRKTDTLTAKEREILRALNQPIELRYDGKTFSDILKDLSTKLKTPILVDEASLKSAEIDTSTTLNIDLPRIATRTALRKILQDKNLTFILRNETIQVMTMEKARETMVTKVYYVGDLLNGGVFGNGAVWGPFLNQAQMMENAERLVKMIESGVDPMSWRSAAGNGSITFHAPSMSLIVRQTAEVHAMMNSLGK